MPSPRTTIIVLLLIVAVAIMFLIVGQSLGGQQPAAPSLAEIGDLKKKFLGPPKRVAWQWPPATGNPCATITSGQQCTLQIPKGSGLTRTVSVHVELTQPMLLEFTPASTPDRTITLDLTQSDRDKTNAEFTVDYKGGSLVLKCRTVGTGGNSPPPCKPGVQ